MQQASRYKTEFSTAFKAFADRLGSHVSSDTGAWTIKGFIDIYKNIYTISTDTKIVSKILEIHLFPLISEFAESIGYQLVLAEKQNWYPDMSFVNTENQAIKFAVDLKTTYRLPQSPGRVNGFTLGSHGEYFKNRTSTKNIQFPYNDYTGHFCLGIIYTRVNDIEERQQHSIDDLRSIVSVVRDFQFFFCEKWQIASDRAGSGNTANIGSVTAIEDIVAGNGVFARLGEDWFDEYWMNYGLATMKKDGKIITIKRLADFVAFKGGDPNLNTPKRKRGG